MVTAIEILPLARVKMELEIPASENSHDALLTAHIGAAVDWIAEMTGLDIADADYVTADFPAGLVQAAAMMTRRLYDGIAVTTAQSTVAMMIRPYLSYA